MARPYKSRTALSSNTSRKIDEEKSPKKAEKTALTESEKMRILEKIGTIRSKSTMEIQDALEDGPLGFPTAKLEPVKFQAITFGLKGDTGNGWKNSIAYVDPSTLPEHHSGGLHSTLAMEMTHFHHQAAEKFGEHVANDPGFWDIDEFPDPADRDEPVN